MKLIAFLCTSVLFIATLTSCGGDSGAPVFCDTVCLKDTLKFSKEDHELKPYLHISTKDCNADTIYWSYMDMGVNRKMNLENLLDAPVKLNKDYLKVVFQDTSYIWMMFNDCRNGRGYQLKIPFVNHKTIGRRNSALNNFDKKFNVAEGLAAYSDRGNIFVEEMATGKQAMMTFGKRIEIDYNRVHDFIDSIYVSPTRMWARVKMGDDWKVFEKNITLK